MRVTRSRTAAKKRPAHDTVDLDSDEFEEALAAAEQSPLQRNKRQKQNSKAGRAEASVQGAAGSSDDDAYTLDAEDDVDELEELAQVSGEELDAAGSNMSDSGTSEAADSDYDAKSGTKQGKKGTKAEKKPKKKRQSTRRLCVTYAKAQYGLTDIDLVQLTDVEFKTNPHHPGGYPMRLYLVRELEELARNKKQQIRLLAAAAEQRAMERAAAARAKRAAAAAAAAAAMKAIGSQSLKPSSEKHGSVTLPDTCLARIMTIIVGSLEPGGLRGPSSVAKELYNASLVCWDFYHAAKAGFIALGEAASTMQQEMSRFITCGSRSDRTTRHKMLVGLMNLPGPDKLGGWSFWDKLLQDPTALKIPELKEAVKQLGLTVTGTKAELVLRILDAFKLAAPTTAPAKLLQALVFEREYYHDCMWELPPDDDVHRLRRTIDKLRRAQHPSVERIKEAERSKGVAGIRAQLLKHFSSLAEMEKAADSALAAFRERQVAEQWAREAKRRAELAQRGAAIAAMIASGQVQDAGNCCCGNTAAKACARGCCGICCRRLAAEAAAAPAAAAVVCTRHKA